MARRSQLDGFVAYLTSTDTQAEASGASGRTFRRHHAWCWNVTPTIASTGQVYDCVQLDGIYLDGWCCLIAIAGGRVIGWQWCDQEKKAGWGALLERLAPPLVAVCDGGPGLAGALTQCWPTTRVQRCLVHVQRNARTYLTTHPRTDAGKALWGLAKKLTQITTPAKAATWMAALNAWHQLYGTLITQRTYATQDGAQRPTWARTNQQWWYTHDRLRKAYRLLEHLTRGL